MLKQQQQKNLKRGRKFAISKFFILFFLFFPTTRSKTKTKSQKAAFSQSAFKMQHAAALPTSEEF